MNIYLHIELAVRELDSKLLLATLAASRGHQVIISDLPSFICGLKNRSLAPGIFHTKSLTGSKEKIDRHQLIIDNGFKITSMDEEGGLVEVDYTDFTLDRYSKKTLEQASAILGWGEEDTDALKVNYSSFSNKIFKTGSPRADLWKTNFSSYWNTPTSLPKKPYLLISSNCWNSFQPFHENFKFRKKAGYFDRNPKHLQNFFGKKSEGYTRTAFFIEAIEYIIKNNENNYDIVLRPHPTENPDDWKTFLEDIPNVHVSNEGSITPWVNNSFAVLHNGCTTAFEAIIAKKPLISYMPFETKHTGNISNELGSKVKTLNELLREVNFNFSNIKSNNKKMKNLISDTFANRIYIDNNETAAEKIIKVWEGLDDKNLSSLSKLNKFQNSMRYTKMRKATGNLLRNFFNKKPILNKRLNKFPKFRGPEIHENIKRLKHILRINEKIEFKLLSEKSLLIKKS